MTELVQSTTETDYNKALAAVARINRLATKAETASVAKPKAASEPLVLKPKAQEAVENFAEAAKTVQFPTYPRELTPDEVNEYLPLFRQVQGLDTAAKEARARIRQAVYNHLDAEIEDDGAFRGSTLPIRDDKGHFVTEGALTTEESDYIFSREVKNYAPELPVEAVHQLWVEGKITRSDYYRATKKKAVPRDIDEEGFAGLLASKPQLAEVFASVLVSKPPTTSLNIRAKEKND